MYQKFRVNIIKNGQRDYVTLYAPDEKEAADSIRETFDTWEVESVEALDAYAEEKTFYHTGK